MSKPTRVIVGIGSNIDPRNNIPAAVSALREISSDVGVSTVYSSAPVGRVDQPPFLNGAARITTELTPAALKQALLGIESQLGRVRDPNDKSGPRTIDLDVVVYGDLEDAAAGIPDSDLTTRWFLALPAAELWPDWRHPGSGERLDAIAERLREQVDGKPVDLLFE